MKRWYEVKRSEAMEGTKRGDTDDIAKLPDQMEWSGMKKVVNGFDQDQRGRTSMSHKTWCPVLILCTVNAAYVGFGRRGVTLLFA